MANRIQQLSWQLRLEDPAEAEVWLSVIPESRSPATEIRGRITGPRCAFATTVEVGYPLRPFQRPATALHGIASRVVIPESSLWEPLCPFLYQGLVELWEDGQLCDQIQVTLGMRTVSLGSRGLRLNGKPFPIRAMVRDQLSDGEALALRQADINTLVIPWREQCQELWPVADRWGFFILGLLENEEAVTEAKLLADHPSCLGWVLAEGIKEEPKALAILNQSKPGPLVGVERTQAVEKPLAPGVNFVLCEASSISSLDPKQISKVIYLDKFPAREMVLPPGCLGWVMKSSV